MEDIKGFICSLVDRGINLVAIDIGEKNLMIETTSLMNEIKKIGFAEIADTYYEDMSFISNNGDLIEVHAFY